MGTLLNIVHEKIEKVSRDGQQIERGSSYGTINVECGEFRRDPGCSKVLHRHPSFELHPPVPPG